MNKTFCLIKFDVFLSKSDDSDINQFENNEVD